MTYDFFDAAGVEHARAQKAENPEEFREGLRADSKIGMMIALQIPDLLEPGDLDHFIQNETGTVFRMAPHLIPPDLVETMCKSYPGGMMQIIAENDFETNPSVPLELLIGMVKKDPVAALELAQEHSKFALLLHQHADQFGNAAEPLREALEKTLVDYV